MDYINPGSMMPNPQDFESTNLLSVQNARQRMDMAQPFIQMAQQQQAMEMQKKQQENSEFMSPEAMRSRFSGFQKTTAENTAAAQVAPEKAKFDVAKARGDLENLPFMNEKAKQEAIQAGREAQGKPYAKLIEDMGNLHAALEKAPEAIRPMLYQEGVKRWQMEHPGAQLPQEFQQYNPQTLAQVRYAQLHTPKFEQDMAKTREEITGRKEVAAGHDTAHLQAASIAAKGGVEQAKVRSTTATDKPVNSNVRVTQLRRQLANPNLDADAREEATAELNSHLEDSFATKISRDPLLKEMASMAAFGQPGALEKYNNALVQKRKEHFAPVGGNNKPTEAETPKYEQNKVYTFKTKNGLVNVKLKPGRDGTKQDDWTPQ
jgi:hypothetical protein